MRVDLSLMWASAIRLRQLLASDGLLGAVSLTFKHLSAVGRAFSLRLAGLRLASIGVEFRIKGRRHIRIGKSSSFGRRVWLEAIANHRRSIYSPKISIGSGVSFNDDVHVAAASAVSIGDDCLLGSRIIVTDHNHGSYSPVHESDPLSPPSERALVATPVHIGARTWIGDGVVILPGTIIGSGSVIGANSVVRGHFPENSVIVGSPAKMVKRYSFLTATWMASAGFQDLKWDDQ
jgi:lipopolysaccharide O-acetyltransferase